MNSRSEIYKTIREMAEQVEQMRATEEALRNQIDLMKEEVRRTREEGDRLDAAFRSFLESTVIGLSDAVQVIDCGGEKYRSRTYPKYRVINGDPGVYVSRLDARRYLGITMAELSRLYMSGAVSVYKRGHGTSHGYRFKFSELEKYKRNLTGPITVTPQVTS